MWPRDISTSECESRSLTRASAAAVMHRGSWAELHQCCQQKWSTPNVLTVPRTTVRTTSQSVKVKKKYNKKCSVSLKKEWGHFYLGNSLQAPLCKYFCLGLQEMQVSQLCHDQRKYLKKFLSTPLLWGSLFRLIIYICLTCKARVLLSNIKKQFMVMLCTTEKLKKCPHSALSHRRLDYVEII